MTNGSEGIAEYPGRPDYTALIARVRDYYTCADALHRDMADAVEVLVAENERLRENRGWDGEWRTLHQTEEEARRILMRWSKAQLVNAHVADWQRDVRNENWVADRLVKMTTERDALREQLAAAEAKLVSVRARHHARQVQIGSSTHGGPPQYGEACSCGLYGCSLYRIVRSEGGSRV